MYYLCSENKGVISFAVTTKLICVFVFAYADCWFSHAVAHLICLQEKGIPLPVTPKSPWSIDANLMHIRSIFLYLLLNCINIIEKWDLALGLDFDLFNTVLNILKFYTC